MLLFDLLESFLGPTRASLRDPVVGLASLRSRREFVDASFLPYGSVMSLAVLTDLLSWKVLDMFPCILPWSIPEPADVEHRAPVVIIPLSDKLVENSLHLLLT